MQLKRQSSASGSRDVLPTIVKRSRQFGETASLSVMYARTCAEWPAKGGSWPNGRWKVMQGVIGIRHVGGNLGNIWKNYKNLIMVKQHFFATFLFLKIYWTSSSILFAQKILGTNVFMILLLPCLPALRKLLVLRIDIKVSHYITTTIKILIVCWTKFCSQQWTNFFRNFKPTPVTVGQVLHWKWISGSNCRFLSKLKSSHHRKGSINFPKFPTVGIRRLA